MSATIRHALLAALLLGSLVHPALAEDKPFTRREQKERIAKLPDAHRQFLLDVEPILQSSERDAFLRMETDAQRESFIDDFWRRRDRMAGTTNGAARNEYYARLEFVKENFEQVTSDRGKIYLIQGQPQALVDIKCPSLVQPIQIWSYDYIPAIGHDVLLLFYLPRQHREFRLWQPIRGKLAGLSLDELRSDSIAASGNSRGNLMDCPDGELLIKAIAKVQDVAEKITKVFDAPAVNEEDVHRALRSAVILDKEAPKLLAEASASYPSGDGSKTDVQLTLMVPRAQLKTTAVSGVSVYTLDVVGEVLKDEQIWEKYRYRFDFPGDITDEKLPIVVDRMLRPATYTSRVKITDAATNAQTLIETPLVVPDLGPAKPLVTAETSTLQALQGELQSSRASLRIVPLADGVTSGLQTIQTIVSGNVAGVEFWLDGKKIATRRAPPYTLDLDFGTMPRSRRIRAVAIDSHGATIVGDEVVVNTGTDPFRVRIVSPRIAPKLSGPTRVELDVQVPAGKKLAGVDLYWNEQRVATMFDPPFVQTVQIPKGDAVGYLRAVARLDDPEIDPAEDLVLVNTPDYMEEVNVHLVELPTTVMQDGKMRNDLQESAFTVLDEGKAVKIAKFEHVTDVPLSIGMAVDASGSMEPRMTAAREAGAAFFKNVLRSSDKAFLVAFDSTPHVVQPWSSDLQEIYGGLAKLRPEESTALYDAIVYSLYQFVGVKGQKALVLITDGKDTVSKFSFEQALEYAQRTAVPIYAIGIGIRGSELDVKSKLNRLASETGGASYYIEEANDLSRIYTDIENELRSQYIIGFYPPAEVKPGGKWRQVEVQVSEGKAKTIRGYYP